MPRVSCKFILFYPLVFCELHLFYLLWDRILFLDTSQIVSGWKLRVWLYLSNDFLEDLVHQSSGQHFTATCPLHPRPHHYLYWVDYSVTVLSGLSTFIYFLELNTEGWSINLFFDSVGQSLYHKYSSLLFWHDGSNKYVMDSSVFH